MVNDLYLTVLYRQIGDKTQKFPAKFERPSADELAQMQAEAFTGMEEVCEQIMEGMKGYGIKRPVFITGIKTVRK
ncbi:hypothetical protein [Enterobacter cloacae]|uniref:hypothetical protein n=1 Tax=Enterobacter cloacae TaxID=550 RepID=UPI00388F67FF